MIDSAVDLAQAVSEDRLTPKQICAEHLATIDRTDSAIDAWAWHDPDAALAQAGKIEAGLPLSGVPVGLKDIIDSVDMPCCLGSSLFAGRQPQTDAELVQRLRAAGALIMGKTRTTEFAYLQRCETRNPHNSRFSPGGSSSALRRRLPQVRSRWRLARKQAGLLSALRPIAVYMASSPALRRFRAQLCCRPARR